MTLRQEICFGLALQLVKDLLEHMGVLLSVPDHYLTRSVEQMLHLQNARVKHLTADSLQLGSVFFRKMSPSHGSSSSGIRGLPGESCESLVGFCHCPATTGLPVATAGDGPQMQQHHAQQCLASFFDAGA